MIEKAGGDSSSRTPAAASGAFKGPAERSPNATERLALRLLMRRLRGLTGGSLRITLPDGRELIAGSGEPAAHAIVHDYGLFPRVLLGGDIGLGEAYREGLWDSPDLVQAAETVLGQRATASPANSPLARPLGAVEAVAHALHTNTLRNSRGNIVAHYDEGNEFFRHLLGPSMTYSCAVFPEGESGLDAAQGHKLEMIATKLALSPGDEVLDIGCGFGSFALLAARSYGCRVDACTLSPSQAQLARERVAEAGLDGSVRIMETDYRSLPGGSARYSKVACIGMYEHVGRRHQKEFWRVAEGHLRPGGRLVLQTIVRTSRRPGPVSWVQKHVFPGGYLPSLAEVCREATRPGGLRVVQAEEIGPHYATTLREWRRNLLAALEEPGTLEMTEERRRHWLYFLSTCEAAFRTGTISNYQIVVARD